MSEFNKDDYLNDLPDADNLSAIGQAALPTALPPVLPARHRTRPSLRMRLLIRALPARLGTRRPPKRTLPIRPVTPLPRVRMTERPPTTR